MAGDFTYAVVLIPEPTGGFVVSCPDFPELLTEGSTHSEAVEQAADALEEVFAARIRRGEEIPEPSLPADESAVAWVRLPPINAAKAALALALRGRGMTQSELARTMGVDEKEVRRLLDPRHPSKLARLQDALLVLDQHLELRIVEGVTPEIAETEARSYRLLADHAEALATRLFPSAVREGRAIPVHELVAPGRFSEIAGCRTTISEDASLREEAVAEYRRGAIAVRLRPDVLKGAAGGNARFRFTVAHELAHLALHRDDLVRNKGRAFRDLVTPSEKLPVGVPIYRSPEWQANAWAGAFLMPLPAVRAFLSGLRKHGREFTEDGLAANFQVSRQAASIRLQKLLPDLVSQRSRA